MPRRTSSGMPQIVSAFNGWNSRVVLLKHRETVVNGLVEKQEVAITFYGTIQPLSPRAIELKPEGQRSFEWLQIHCQARATNLIPGDRIKWNGRNYKVMAKLDYSLNNYMEFHCIADYQGGAQ